MFCSINEEVNDLLALVEQQTMPSKPSLTRVVGMMKAAGISYQEAVLRFQAAYVEHVLAKNRGHLGKTAVELGIHRNTMTRTLRLLETKRGPQ